ncbi:MAG: hypothetical protein EG823_09340 [Actinobacteria bacterium]|nr:hypothetical protein [Actinomycetota bacterium]
MNELQVEVLSMPSWETGLDSDLHRLKSGLLYGDSVTVRSLPLATTYYAARIAHGGLSDREVFSEMLESAQYLDDEAFEPEGKRAMLSILRGYLEALDTAEAAGDKVALGQIHEAAEGLRSAQLEDFGQTGPLKAGIEIADAEMRGLVEVRRMRGLHSDSALEAMVKGVAWWENEIAEAIRNPKGIVFADETAMGIIAAGVDLRGKAPGVHRAKAAQLAGELFSRLPLLPFATIDELVDVRSRLQAPLTRFRAEMLRVGEELESEAYSDELVAEIDNYIIERVEPAILEIGEAFSVDAYLKQLASRGSSALGKYLAPGSTLAAAVVSGDVTTTLATAGIAALGLGGAALVDTLEDQASAKKSGLFFYQRLARDYRA